MELATINVDVDQKQLRDYIQKKIDESIHQTFFTIDINKLSELTCISKSSLELDILQDPRIKQFERRKPGGKRYWFYEPTMEAIKQIMDAW